jgi:hypothetical protein
MSTHLAVTRNNIRLYQIKKQWNKDATGERRERYTATKGAKERKNRDKG